MLIEFKDIWKEVVTYDQDFRTHSNYVAFIADLSKNIKLITNRNCRNKIQQINKNLDKKIRLIILTQNALKEEHEIILQTPEYAVAASSWVAVKSYYLIFDLLLIVKYLLKCDNNAFNTTHSEIQNFIKKSIQAKDFFFNIEEANKIWNIKQCLDWNAPSGENLKIVNIDCQKRYTQILKKLAKYKVEEFKRHNNIKRLSSRWQEKVYKLDINICEFFYLYRIKANYRDMEFLAKDVAEKEFAIFYVNYFNLTSHFYNAFRIFINDLSRIRIGKELL